MEYLQEYHPTMSGGWQIRGAGEGQRQLREGEGEREHTKEWGADSVH